MSKIYLLMNLQKFYLHKTGVTELASVCSWLISVLIGLNFNIPVNTIGCFQLTDFWATLCMCFLFMSSEFQ
jgi:hypothetical protein